MTGPAPSQALNPRRLAHHDGSVPAVIAQQPHPTNMRVALAFVERYVNIWLRFGTPVAETTLDRWRRVAIFPPGAVCARVKWLGNDSGTALWQLMVLQAPTPSDAMQRVAGVTPGARILLQASGESAVKSVLDVIGAIEAADIDSCAVAPAYWRTVGNRLAARQPLPLYKADRHAAHLAKRSLQ